MQDYNANDRRHTQNLFESQSLFHETIQADRRRQIIPKDKKLLLEAVIDLGISGNFAQKILGLTSSSRLMRNLSIQREEREAELEKMPTEERLLHKAQDAEDRKKAHF